MTQSAHNTGQGARSAEPWIKSVAGMEEVDGAKFRRQYDAIVAGPAIVDRSYRRLLEVRGPDRAAWLHNLLTNQVKPLGSGDGVYAFALNVQGRILFDCNVWAQHEAIWLDIAREFLPISLKHLEKYHITENVTLADRSDEFVRIGFSGDAARQVAEELGAPHAARMPVLGITTAGWRGHTIPLVRHDFCGPFGIDLFVPPVLAQSFWQEWTSSDRTLRAIPVGDGSVQARRIEAGIPWSGREITDEYLPAETGQLARAVSNQKGCYLGQEIVERMRARGVVARKLVGLVVEASDAPPLGCAVADESGKPIGSVTSSCKSPAIQKAIALGYVRTPASNVGNQVQLQTSTGPIRATVHELPITGQTAD